MISFFAIKTNFNTAKNLFLGVIVLGIRNILVGKRRR
jgi:hypothetical protein